MMNVEEIRLFRLLRKRPASTAEPAAADLPVRWRLAGAALQAWHACRHVGPLVTAEDALGRIRAYAEGQPVLQHELRAAAARVLTERDGIVTPEFALDGGEPQVFEEDPPPELVAAWQLGFEALYRCARLAVAGQEAAAHQAAQDAMRLIPAWLRRCWKRCDVAEAVRRRRIVVAKRYPARDGDVPIQLDVLVDPRPVAYRGAPSPELSLRGEVAALLLLLRSGFAGEDGYVQELGGVDRWVRGLPVTAGDLARQEARLHAEADDALAESRRRAIRLNGLRYQWYALDAVRTLARAAAADDVKKRHLWFARSFWCSSLVLIPRFAEPDVLSRGIWRVLAAACPAGTPPDSDIPVPARLLPLGSPLSDPDGPPSATTGGNVASQEGESI